LRLSRRVLGAHLRALLLERGIVAPQGRRKLGEELSVFAVEDGIEALSPRIRLLIDLRLNGARSTSVLRPSTVLWRGMTRLFDA
jgi:hypothetical protein